VTLSREAILDRTTLLAYALPGFVLAIPTIPIYIYLPVLYGTTFGLGLALTGGILFAARFFDVVTDPIIGRVSDTIRWSAWRRKPLIVFGAVIAAIGLVRIVSPPPEVDWTYLLIWSGVLYLGWTLVAIPYAAWGAELCQDYRQRLRITSAREAAALLGILSASAFPAVIILFGYSEATALSALAWLTVLAGIPVIWFLVSRVPEIDARSTQAAARSNTKSHVSSLKDNGPFCRLIAAWMINGFANGLPAALFILYLQYGLEADAAIRPRFIFIYFLAAVLAIPLWQKLSQHLGKHRTWCLSMALAVAAFACVPLIEPGAFGAFFLVCIITGASLGADLALPPAIQADVVDYDNWKYGEPRTGFLFALWSMATKFAQALAVGVGLPLVTFMGFDPGQLTDSGQIALTVIYAWLPIVFKLIAIALVWNFALTERRLVTIQMRLAGRRQFSGNEG
jgi:glycoside/pentoside/hexuronide:cation symporter, GPH family